MCLLNHCSVQTEFSEINPLETESIPNLNSKILLQSFLLPILISITLCFAATAALSQETTDSDLSQSFEEDPLSESDPELGLDEDPLSVSDQETATDEGSLEGTTTGFGSKDNQLEETILRRIREWSRKFAQQILPCPHLYRKHVSLLNEPLPLMKR